MDNQAAVGRAYTAVASAKKTVTQMENRRQDMIANLTALSEIETSKIQLNDRGALVGLKPSTMGNCTAAAVPDFPSSSELKGHMTQLQEAKKVLAKAERELSQLIE